MPFRMAALAVCVAVMLAVSVPRPDAWPVPVDRGAAGLWQALLKLHSRASLMMITAHPDDEDGGMLTYESRGKGTRVVLLSLTRGESGANVMSPDYFDALGLVRTEELLAADRYYDVDQYFGRVINNGFSKTKEETYGQWTHDRVLYDAVRVVRLTRPLVIASVFIGGPSDGHGNHQVAGQTTQEVFRAAGDPNVFPDQIRAGLRPWKPLKVYARVPMARVTAQGVYDYATHHWAPAKVYDYVHERWLPWDLSVNVRIPEGREDPLMGVSYAQLARQGLGFQKSQNGGASIPASGELTSDYHRFASGVTVKDRETSFFDGIDTSLAGMAGEHADLRRDLAAINADVETAMHDFDARHPEKIAPVLASGLRSTNALISTAKPELAHELVLKQGQFYTALSRSLGLSMQSTVAPERPVDPRMAAFLGTPESFRVAIPGQQFSVSVHVNNSSAVPVEFDNVRLEGMGEPLAVRATLVNNEPRDVRLPVKIPESASYTRPYFSRPSVNQGYYAIEQPRYVNLPYAPYPFSVAATFLYAGVPIRLEQVVQSVKRVTGPGTVLQPLVIGPALSVAVNPGRGIIPLDAKTFRVTATVHSNLKAPGSGWLRLDLPPGWSSTPATVNFSTTQDGDEQQVEFVVTPSLVKAQQYTITAIAGQGGREYREGYRITGYPGLRPNFLYRPSAFVATGVDAKVAPGLRVAYIAGTGDEVSKAIENLGVPVSFLSAADLASGDLSRYDAILLGVRAYAVREDLKANNARLLEFVKNGGVAIVQYNTPEFDHNYGPYPYSMTGDPEEVTDEGSKVNILAPDHPVFTWPNKMTTVDFDGWISERGSKFLATWDARYEPLLETHDVGQDEQKGGLLYARYGKGVYIYNAYAFYRQLPEGVPGAYRILANLVSLSKNPKR